MIPMDQQSIGVLVERVTNLTEVIVRVERAVSKVSEDHEQRIRAQAESAVTQALQVQKLETQVANLDNQQKSNVEAIHRLEEKQDSRTWQIITIVASALVAGGITIIGRLLVP